MWPFKKKKSIQKIDPKVFKTIICIPGNWKDWNEFIISIVGATEGEYIAAGFILINASKQKHYQIEFCERDDKMKEAFKYAGIVSGVSETFLNEIEEHRYVVYISATTGNLEDARHIAFAADAILKAGGIGIKIETAGKAFEREQWQEMIANFDETTLYKMFVVDSIVNKKEEVYTCGMHNFGLKDTVVSGLEFQHSVQLLRIFGYYQIIDNPTILPGQTFTPSPDSTVYRITNEIKQPSEGSALFENPFGIWRLTMANN